MAGVAVTRKDTIPTIGDRNTCLQGVGFTSQQIVKTQSGLREKVPESEAAFASRLPQTVRMGLLLAVWDREAERTLTKHQGTLLVLAYPSRQD